MMVCPNRSWTARKGRPTIQTHYAANPNFLGSPSEDLPCLQTQAKRSPCNDASSASRQCADNPGPVNTTDHLRNRSLLGQESRKEPSPPADHRDLLENSRYRGWLAAKESRLL